MKNSSKKFRISCERQVEIAEAKAAAAEAEVKKIRAHTAQLVMAEVALATEANLQRQIAEADTIISRAEIRVLEARLRKVSLEKKLMEKQTLGLTHIKAAALQMMEENKDDGDETVTTIMRSLRENIRHQRPDPQSGEDALG